MGGGGAAAAAVCISIAEKQKIQKILKSGTSAAKAETYDSLVAKSLVLAPKIKELRERIESATEQGGLVSMSFIDSGTFFLYIDIMVFSSNKYLCHDGKSKTC